MRKEITLTNQLIMEGKDSASYSELYSAAQNGDWKTVKKLLDENPDSKTAQISDIGHTILHLAVRKNGCMALVEELLTSNSPDSLETTDNDGDTALSYAAIAGNTKAAIIMVERNENLLRMRNNHNHTPLHLAAKYGHKNTVNFLYKKAKEGKEDPSVFTGKSGAGLLEFLITSNLYGIALNILQQQVKLENNNEKRSVIETLGFFYRGRLLENLAQKPLAFASGNDLGFLQRLIFQWIPVTNDYSTLPQTEETTVPLLDIEKGKVVQKERRISFWNTMKQIVAVPSINRIHNMKQALEIVRVISRGMTMNHKKAALASMIFEKPILIATKLGIEELVKEIITVYPDSTDFRDEKKRNIFQLAVLHRQERVFNLIHRMGDKHLVTSHEDVGGKNILDLAGELQPSSRISGAALQMQRALQWFKAVESLVDPSSKEKRNCDGKTPREVFNEKHKPLVKEGQEWMKNTAQSYTVVAALITTVVFTALFTVPGGNNNEGVPNYLNTLSFLIFSISDALALFLSSTSVLMFLGILTSSYSEEDFFKSLPKKLILGLLTLFLSIAFMMATFGAALHIVLDPRLEWDVIPISILICLTVIIFTRSQFPLLVEIYRSTYRPSIFQPKKEQLS